MEDHIQTHTSPEEAEEYDNKHLLAVLKSRPVKVMYRWFKSRKYTV